MVKGIREALFFSQVPETVRAWSLRVVTDSPADACQANRRRSRAITRVYRA
jgi:hypothetical protein